LPRCAVWGLSPRGQSPICVFRVTLRAVVRPSRRGYVLRDSESSLVLDSSEPEFRRSLFEALAEASADGILVVSPEGRILSLNRRFVELWRIPDEVIETGTDEAAIEAVLDRLVDPEAFRSRIAYLYEHPEERSLDELELTDGRVFDRYSTPITSSDGTIFGRVWFFRDVTDERRAEAAVRKQLEQLETISRVADAVDRFDRLGDVLTAATEELVATTSADRAAVLLFDDDCVMRFRAWRGLSDEYRAAVDGHSPWTADERDPRPFSVADASTDDSLAPFRAVILAEGIRALGFVPLVHRSRLVGKFMLYRNEPGAFASAELQLAQTVGSHLAAVAERRRAEEALLKSRSELEAILRQVADGITVQDETGAVVYANDAAARLIGFPTAAQLIATPVAEVMQRFEMFDERDEPFPVERLPGRLALQGLESEAAIRYRVKATNQERWSVVRATPIFDERGEVRFAVNAFHDVTARKAAEDRLRLLAVASEILAQSFDYHQTFASIARLIVGRLADSCHIWIEENGVLVRVAFATSELVRDGMLRTFPDRLELDDERALTARVYRTREPLLMSEISPEQLPGITPTDEAAAALARLPVRSGLSVPLLHGDRAIGVLSFASLVASRHNENDLALAQLIGRRLALAVVNAHLYAREQEARREAEARAQAAEALAFTAEGVCMVDNDGNVRLWNPAAASITGIAESDLVGRRLVAVVPSWSRVDAQADGDTSTVSVPIDVSGRELWLSVSTARFPGGSVYAFRDLTHERALEQMKSDFVSTVSHELRTPLAAIYGAAMTLRRPDLAGPGRGDELLAVIASESERLARTINDVLWASRLDSGQLHVSIESCDPAKLVDGVIAAARTHLPANLSLEFVVPPELPRVAADPDKVRQVMSNLVDNAVKYSPDGGVVKIELAPNGRSVRFAVRDQGLGIPPGERDRIFEKFYRLDPNLTRGVGGTGLGLYICRELVARMGGRISVDSAEGDGSTFTFELPVAA
jgi:PAS domain S-box-containing protein